MCRPASGCSTRDAVLPRLVTCLMTVRTSLPLGVRVGRVRRHWPKTRIVWRGDSHYGRVEAMEWAEDHDADYIFGLAGNAALDALVAETAVNLRFIMR
jgi:hypothetical protein